MQRRVVVTGIGIWSYIAMTRALSDAAIILTTLTNTPPVSTLSANA